MIKEIHAIQNIYSFHILIAGFFEAKKYVPIIVNSFEPSNCRLQPAS